MIIRINEAKDLSDVFNNKFDMFVVNARHEYFINNFLLNLKNADYNVTRLTEKNKVREEVDSLQFYQLVTGKRKALILNNEFITKKNLEYILDKMPRFKYENILVLTNTDFKVKLSLSKIRAFSNSDKICYMDLSFPSRRFLIQIVEIYMYARGRQFENSDVTRLLINRLADSYDNYSANLDNLIDISESVITKEMIMEAVLDYSNYSLDAFHSSLIKLNRKQIPFKSLADILENREPINVMYGLENFMKYLYQAKYLKNRGVLMNNDFIERQKEYFRDRSDLHIPKKTSLFRQSNRRINFFLDLADFITIDEIIRVQELVSSSWRRGKTGNKYIEKQDLYALTMKILDRRNVQ